MNTRSAYLVAGLYLVSLTADLIVSVGNGSDLLPGLAVLIMVALGAVGLLGIPDDPLPVRYVAAARLRADRVYLSFIGTPPPRPVLNRRGSSRRSLPSPPTCASVAGPARPGCCCVWWGRGHGVTQRYGDGATQGLALGAINFGPLFMATLSAFTIRPAAASIYALRRRAVERNAAQVASLAAVAEHDKQMRALNQRVRPMLERITDQHPLTDDERTECLALRHNCATPCEPRSWPATNAPHKPPPAPAHAGDCGDGRRAWPRRRHNQRPRQRPGQHGRRTGLGDPRIHHHPRAATGA